jgi:hypothetical protein
MFACPVANCGGTSANSQGVVAHLRMVHRMEKPERDALMGTLAPVAARDYAAVPDMRPCKTCGKPCNWTGGKTPFCDTYCEAAAPVAAPSTAAVDTLARLANRTARKAEATRKPAAKADAITAKIAQWLEVPCVG